MHTPRISAVWTGLILLATLIQTPACLAETDYEGRVVRQGTRLARPEANDEGPFHFKAGTASKAPMQADVSAETFMLDTKLLSGEAKTEGWHPWTGNAVSSMKIPHLTGAAASVTSNLATSDFEGVERSYADAVPKPLVKTKVESGPPPVYWGDTNIPYTTAAFSAMLAANARARAQANSAASAARRPGASGGGGGGMVGGCPGNRQGGPANTLANTQSPAATPGQTVRPQPVRPQGIAAPGQRP